MSIPSDITLVPEPSRTSLSERELVDYESHRESLLSWCLAFGKDPERAEGYAATTVSRRAHRIDQFYRWVWDDRGYTTEVTHEDADEYMRELVYGDASDTHKANTQKALKMLFRWRAQTRGDDEWEPEVAFTSGSGATQPKDFLTREERTRIREAALEYGSTPHYKSLDPAERQEWKRYLAQRFEKPVEDVGKADFARANGFKIPSLVWVSLDTGLRPTEVERATTTWVDVDNRLLRIPAEESAKNTDHWRVSVQDRTAKFLGRWLDERDLYEKYHDTDLLWLTREANPYQSASLRYVLGRLCEEAQIPTENRSLSWYAIRHSVGTYMTREEGLAAAQSQLRHKSSHTTMKYDQTPVEDRRDALDRMG